MGKLTNFRPDALGVLEVVGVGTSGVIEAKGDKAAGDTGEVLKASRRGSISRT